MYGCIFVHIQTYTLIIIYMLGEPVTQTPALARQDNKQLHELSYNRRSFLRNTEIISYHQLEEFRKCQNERGDSSPYVLPISQSRYHWKPSWLRDAWATRKDPESEWLARDNRKLTPSPYNVRLWASWQSSSPGSPYSAALPPGHPSQ